MFINNDIIDVLISQARQDAPNETCGYLLGVSSDEGDVVTENYWRELLDGEYRPLSGTFLFCAEGPVCCLEICTKQRLEDPRQLAQSSSLTLASFSGGPPSG